MYNKRSYGVFPRTIGGLMEDVLQNGWNRVNEEVNAYHAPVNILETDKSYELHVVAPGLKKEDFKINLDQSLIHISYEHKTENKEQQPEENKEPKPLHKWLRSEFRMKSFKRSFNLNEKVDAGNISAKYTDGVLTVTLPKKEVTEPTVHEINVN